jgi:hypothetical protein
VVEGAEIPLGRAFHDSLLLHRTGKLDLVGCSMNAHVQIATRSVESFGRKSSQSSLQALIADEKASLARHPSAVVQSSHAPNEMNL